MNRVAVALVAILCLLSISSIAGLIHLAKADGETITINADGSISPSTAPIYSVDNMTYTLTGNFTAFADGIVIERDSIVVDGQDYTVQGTGRGTGITLSVSNVTVENTEITTFDYGILLNSSSNTTISGNNITNNWCGIDLYSSNYSNISGNTFTNDGLSVWNSYQNSVKNNTINGEPLVYLEGVLNRTVDDAGQVVLNRCENITVVGLGLSRTDYGIELWETSNSTISGNNITNNNDDGIELDSSSNYNIISGNNITNNEYDGIELDSSSNYNIISENNITNNEYALYLSSSSYNIISGNNITANYNGGLWLWSSSNNTISGNNETNNYSGSWLEFSSNYNIISGNNITKSTDGVDADFSSNYNIISGNNMINDISSIFFSDSSSNIISANNIIASRSGGIGLDSSSNDSISGNNVLEGSSGMWLYYCSGNSISGNNVANNNALGIRLDSSSDNNTLSGNNVANNYDGGIGLDSSSGNTLSSNNVTANNLYGISLTSSSNNFIFHNSFVNNTSQVSTDGSVNIWDDGYPSGGNYWSNYNGTDVKNGSYQNETGSDGIGDTPYLIDANNTDYFPLMGMFSSFTGYPVNIISNSTISGFVAPIELEHPEITTLTFNVTGTNGSTGFCRVSFSTAMMNGTYHVSVNGTEIPYTLLSCSNANVSYLYFTYKHSTEQVIILPEFPSFVILPLMMMATLLAVIIYKKKDVKTSQSWTELEKTQQPTILPKTQKSLAEVFGFAGSVKSPSVLGSCKKSSARC